MGNKDKTEYKGFMHLRCEHCGAVRTLNINKYVSDYKCQSCGETMPLRNLHRAYFRCECGGSWAYNTNLDCKMIELNCVRCSAPMTAEMDKSGTYQPIVR